MRVADAFADELRKAHDGLQFDTLEVLAACEVEVLSHQQEQQRYGL